MAGFAVGCDVGSQSLKAVLLDPSGSVVADAAVRYEVCFPRPGWAEQDPAAWRTALATAVGALIAASGVHPAEIGALALASQVDGLVAIDASLQPLQPAIIWLDRRAVEQAERLRARLDPVTVRRATGLNIDASHVAPKILWLRDAIPGAYDRAVAFLLPGSYLVAWLTGEIVVDHANASSTLLYDVRSMDWSTELLAATGIPVERLARIGAAAEIAGRIRPEAARTLGLTTTCLVAIGTGDEHAASLAAGAIRPGVVCDITGTAEPVAAAATTPVIDETGLLETHGHADPRVWLVENPGFVSGGSVRWFVDGVGHMSEDRMNAVAATVPAGSDGVTFLPALSGATAPRWNDAARGAYAGLSLNHGLPHLGRALLEGCTFALRDIVDRLDEMGLAGDEIRVVGGGARSSLWLQMKADVTGRTIRTLVTDEATALGAACLAGVVGGTFSDLDEAVARLVVLDPITHEPTTNPGVVGAYADAYGRYRRLFDAVEPLFSGWVDA